VLKIDLTGPVNHRSAPGIRSALFWVRNHDVTAVSALELKLGAFGAGHCWALMLTLAARLMRKFSMHPVPRVCIVLSGMSWARQGEQDMAQSKNPVVAGLRDPRTPLERPCCNPAPGALALRVASACIVHVCILN